LDVKRRKVPSRQARARVRTSGAQKAGAVQASGPERLWIRVLSVLVFVALIAATVAYGYYYTETTNVSQQSNFLAYSSVAQSFIFPSIVFMYLLLRGRRLGWIIGNLRLSREALNMRNLLVGLGLFFVIVFMEIGVSVFSEVTGIPLPTNVMQVLGGLPIWFLVFSFLIDPINEEILFRGFLVPRIGIIASAVIFAAGHLGYGSLSEVVAALVFGLLAGYALKRTNSLYTSVFAHMLVNFLTIITLIFALG
jgi:hypothetical protein